jgi:hypothetical protein
MSKFGTKMEEVKVAWREFHNEQLHSSHSSLNIIRMISSRRVRWDNNVARMGGKRNS